MATTKAVNKATMGKAKPVQKIQKTVKKSSETNKTNTTLRKGATPKGVKKAPKKTAYNQPSPISKGAKGGNGKAPRRTKLGV